MTKLSDKQRRFAKLVPRLIDMAHNLGYEVTLGDAYRDPRVFGNVGEKAGYGNPSSLHKSRLAIDLNLFKDKKYLHDDDGYKALGEWWESQGGTWGGRFKDPNHFSMEHQGRR